MKHFLRIINEHYLPIFPLLRNRKREKTMEDYKIVNKFEENKDVRESASYYDNRIALIDDLHNLNKKTIVKIEAFMVVLCVKGKASLYINDKFHEIRTNDLFICPPNIMLESSMISIDFECRCILFSNEYIRQLSIMASGNWDIKLFFDKNPILPLQMDEVELFLQYYNLLQMKTTTTSRKHQKELLDCLIHAFLYEFTDAIERFVKLKPPTYNSAESLFKDFIGILSSSYPKNRMVSYYASRLYVTPKYLSAVCKEVSGQTASELINHYVVKDIQFLLRKTEKNIKEIANELDFPNLSFFGKYVRKHLGVSPKQYRTHPTE